MYTGTLIKELMATVELAEQKAAQRQLALEQELHAIFTMQIAMNEDNRMYRTFQGAA